MTKPLGSKSVAQVMLSWLGLELVAHEELQTLWAGYGQICALKARAMDATVPVPVPVSWQAFSREDTVHLILKLVSSPAEGRVVGDKDEDEGHVRKMLSYGVEQYFYDEVAPRLGDDVPVARCLASTRSMRDNALAAGIEGLTATIMSDLRLEYPVAGEKRAVLSPSQVHAALDWLAGFHAASWGLMSFSGLDDFILPPLEEQAKRRQQDAKNGGRGGEGGEGRSALWLNGGYTYLATRRTEYDSLACDGQSEWNVALCAPARGSGSESVAEMVARFLTPSGRPFETYIHGDVKSENLFSTVTGDRVALYDFQYVGLGLGVSDLAKLFTCSLPMGMLTGYPDKSIPDNLAMDDGERRLLERYRATLMERRRDEKKRAFEYEWDVFVRHWETALVDWCRFQASWGFWGNTDWLEARVRSILSDGGWHDWLERELQ